VVRAKTDCSPEPFCAVLLTLDASMAMSNTSVGLCAGFFLGVIDFRLVSVLTTSVLQTFTVALGSTVFYVGRGLRVVA